MKTAIIIPMYNEEKMISSVIDDLQSKYNYPVIIVDDASIDNSYQKACKKGVYLIKHIVNLGQGAAIQTGIEYARKLDMDIVVTFDADGQHNSDDIASFVKAIEEGKADIVLGSRFLGRAKNISKFKEYFLKLSRYFTYISTGILLTDSHNGFRAINIKKYPEFEITENRMAHASEIVDLVKRLNMKYIEMPCTITYTDYSKQKGQSIINAIGIVVEYIIGRLTK
jgi:glycosyltransferase involved in cell wall biosynthesis